MQACKMPLSKSVYASLVTGHSRAGDIEGAEKVVHVMKENELSPDNLVYTSLLCAYAERGDVDAIFEVSRLTS